MKLSRLTLTSVSILLGINLASCTGQNVKTSSPPLVERISADCPTNGTLSVQEKVAVTEKTPRTDSNEPKQDLSDECLFLKQTP